MPTKANTIESKVRPQIFATLLNTMKPGRLLDLACGHGVFSLVAVNMGWEATAVDVRTSRMPMTPGVRWIESDVREFQIEPGAYDCIAILGLMYHLELKDQLDLLRRCSFTTTIIETITSLDPVVEEMGYRGEHFDEVAGRTPEQFAASPTASWKNATSFWPDEESHVRMLTDCGYETVFKQTPPMAPERTFYLCLPPLGYDAYPEYPEQAKPGKVKRLARKLRG